MKKTTKFETDNTQDAVDVLINHLDGAIADYGNGDAENDALVESCIEALLIIIIKQYLKPEDKHIKAKKSNRRK